MIRRLRLRWHQRSCTVVNCTRGRFWRDQYDAAQADADRLALQLQALGYSPTRSGAGPRGYLSWGGE